jgi:hypothetical protein
MSDPAQSPSPSTAAPSSTSPSPASPQASPPSTSPATTAPDGKDSTVLTAAAAADPQTDPAKEPSKQPDAPAAFDPAKLSFPEELGKPDEGMLNKFGEIAKSANLTQETAQRLTDLYTETTKAAQEAGTNAWKSTIEQWENEIKKDPMIGGANLETHQRNFAKVLADPRFATDGVVEALVLTGAGSHPAINRFMAKIAKALTEGGMVTGSPPSGAAPKTMAQTIYPNNPSSAGD